MTKQGYTDITIILDRSGSMGIPGINTMSVAYDSLGTNSSYGSTAYTVSNIRGGGKAGFSQSDYDAQKR